MNPLQPFYRQSAYNQWMNQHLYQVCAQLSDHLRKKDMRAFFGSIHGTLNHLLLVDLLWLGRLEHQPVTFDALDQELYSDFAALEAARAGTDQRLDDWIHGLTSTDLMQPVVFTSVVTGQTHNFYLTDVLLHIFHHQTHHRGQLTTLLSQFEQDIGVTDLIWQPGIEILEPF